jgi:lipopolysaccharide biosynthesis protein
VRAAIFAHFDSDGSRCENVKMLLEALIKVFPKVLVVSTGGLSKVVPECFPRVEVIQRPNVGYDFYSYKVGALALLKDSELTDLVFCNSSIAVLDSAKFEAALYEVLSPNSSDLVGLTASSQFEFHVQSYLFRLRLSEPVRKFARNFFGSVRPRNFKEEVIFDYEIGLTRRALGFGLSVSSAYRPTVEDALAQTFRWSESQRKKNCATDDTVGGENPTQWSADRLAQLFGFVKWELLLANPNHIDLSFLTNIKLEAERKRLSSIEPKTVDTRQKKSFFRAKVEIPQRISGRARVGVVLHGYYIDLVPAVFARLQNIVEPFDLFVSTSKEEDIPQLLQYLTYPPTFLRKAEVCLHSNIGRDVGPFLNLLKEGGLIGYDAVLKVHTKKSPYSKVGGNWRDTLLDALCGNSNVVGRVINCFRSSDVGMVGPESFWLTRREYWGANQERLQELRKLWDGNVEKEIELGFFAGTMFWFNPKAFERISTMADDAFEFEVESGQRDGTLAHAWERAVSILVADQGFEVRSIERLACPIRLRADYNDSPVKGTE